MQIPRRSLAYTMCHTLSLGWMMFCAAGCGWKTGSPVGVGVHVGEVIGSSVEPGLRASLRDAVAHAVRLQGAEGPRALQVELLTVEQSPVALTSGGTGMVVTRIDLRVHDPARTACDVEVSVHAPWSLGDRPGDARMNRSWAANDLAEEAARQAISRFVGNEACR